MNAVVVPLTVVITLAFVALTGTALSLRVVQQTGGGAVLGLGWLRRSTRPPGRAPATTAVGREPTVRARPTVITVPTQQGTTRDEVCVWVDAVVHFRVVDPAGATVELHDQLQAVSRFTERSLWSAIERADLAQLLGGRDQLNRELSAALDVTTGPAGVRLDRVEITDVTLPGFEPDRRVGARTP